MMLESDRWKLTVTLFEQACARPKPEPWLREACGDDLQLFEEVRSLLDARQAEQLASIRSAPNSPGRQRYGQWEVLSLLGSGGMGSVFKVRRADGQYEQFAALKLIAPHLAGPYFLERFRIERQILAQLNHPNIAKLLDGGAAGGDEERGEATSEAGNTHPETPYLVMEFVDGLAFDRYADSSKLDLPARLALFLKVCDAVEFAHRNLIVHRDLKPGNIFVETSTGEPKLLDFGTARLLVTEGDPATTTHRLLTPRYASPEALRYAPVTTQTDVFSLGVLLYEQLCGAWPFGDASISAEAIEKITAASMLPPDSRVTQDIAEARSSTIRELKGVLGGDLASIVRKALEASPERRYKSVGDLAADLRAYLAGQPVSARAPTLLYRSSKFLRRHWLPASALGLLIVGLAVAAVFSYRQAQRAEREADLSFAALMGLKQLIESGAADSSAKDMRLADLLAQSEKALSTVDPAMRPAMLSSLSYVSLMAFDFPNAERRAKEAIAQATAVGDTFTLADAHATLANCNTYQYRLDQGMDEARTALRLARDLGDLRRVRFIRFRANSILLYLSLLRSKPEPDTEALFADTLRIANADLQYRADLIWIYRLLAQFRAVQKDDVRQREALDAGLRIYREQRQPTLIQADILEAYRAFLGGRQKDFSGAERFARERYQLAVKLAGADALVTLDPRLAWGLELGRSGNWEAGARELAACRALHASLSPQAQLVSVWKLYFYSAFVENRRANSIEAERFARAAIQGGRQAGFDPSKDARMGDVFLELGTALRLQGRFPEAMAEFERARAAYEVAWGKDHTRYQDALRGLDLARSGDRTTAP